ncbi:hypothetical protein ITP53_32315 [Nonomuraea sp. K274]|uniref:Uncharacterized protein n=1 Tax=Nonomuraea cypriaca TaxID=1187855 RepID=A0A931AE99_9ACTN|nr:hypothetical protein [Nonomuraea cypriaca]MBF8190318.1 hypothetical protein [Nonomuraea cypriaca]
MDELRRADRGLRIARAVMFAQAAASLGIWIVQLLTIVSRLEHNQAVPGSVWLVAVVNPVIAVLAAIAAAFLFTRSWARPLSVAVECVGCLGALISVINGFYQAVVAIAVAVAVIRLIIRYEKVVPPLDLDTHDHDDQPPQATESAK